MNPDRPIVTAKTRKTRLVWTGFFWRIIGFLLIFACGYAGYVGYKLSSLEKKITIETENPRPTKKFSFSGLADSLFSKEEIPLRRSADGQMNILLLGMGGEGHKGKYLTDTIMVASIDTENYKTALLSIPRDLYVKIPDSSSRTKINAIYAYHLNNQKNSPSQAAEAIRRVVREVIGQEIHYYIALDFEGFQKIIGELGGIDIDVPDEIYDARYPGPNYSYQTFQLKQGLQHLDAETALKYSRVRHVKGGDFSRAARQQQVLEAAKKKMFSLGTIFNPLKITSLIDILGENLKTDIPLGEISAFWSLSRKINPQQITNRVLDAWSPDSLLASTHVPMGSVQAYVLIPKAKNYSQIHLLAENIFDLDAIERKKKAIQEEEAVIVFELESDGNYEKLRRSILQLGHPADIRRLKTPSLCQKGEGIISLSAAPKLFTLDDLADKLDMEVRYENDYSESDILVCISDETARYLEKQETEKYTDPDSPDNQDSIVDEQGRVITGQ